MLQSIVILLLLALMVQKELIRAFGSPRNAIWIRALNVAILPLFLAFCIIVMMRLYTMLMQ